DGAGQLEVLIVYADLERRIAALALHARIEQRVALAQAVVVAVTAAVDVAPLHAQREAVAAPVAADPGFVGVVARGPAVDERRTLVPARRLRDDVDRAAGCARAVEYRAAAAHHLDALYRGERDRGPVDRRL